MGKTKKLWEIFRKNRNLVTKLKAISIRKYFDERCNTRQSENGKMFWDTIKPFMRETRDPNCVITIKDGKNIVNDPVVVSNIFNAHFSSVAADFGSKEDIAEDEDLYSIFKMYADHSSIKLIRENNSDVSPFTFGDTSYQHIHRLLKNMDTSKSTGYDAIPAKLLKLAADELSPPLTALINRSITASHFPAPLKKAEVSPLYKAKDNLERNNYRPVSILSGISKVFERVYYDQLYDHFSKIMSNLMAAFRKKYSCEHVLIKLVEDCKAALDNKEHVGLILTDLSKAFECLPHGLLLSKLHAYGVSYKSCKLLCSYLCQRKQRVKLGCTKSDWVTMKKRSSTRFNNGTLTF